MRITSIRSEETAKPETPQEKAFRSVLDHEARGQTFYRGIFQGATAEENSEKFQGMPLADLPEEVRNGVLKQTRLESVAKAVQIKHANEFQAHS